MIDIPLGGIAIQELALDEVLNLELDLLRLRLEKSALLEHLLEKSVVVELLARFHDLSRISWPGRPVRVAGGGGQIRPSTFLS